MNVKNENNNSPVTKICTHVEPLSLWFLSQSIIVVIAVTVESMLAVESFKFVVVDSSSIIGQSMVDVVDVAVVCSNCLASGVT